MVQEKIKVFFIVLGTSFRAASKKSGSTRNGIPHSTWDWSAQIIMDLVLVLTQYLVLTLFKAQPFTKKWVKFYSLAERKYWALKVYPKNFLHYTCIADGTHTLFASQSLASFSHKTQSGAVASVV